MAGQKLFAGFAVRRLRRTHALTQAAMASILDISPSYLNLIEANQRPLTAPLMLRLADKLAFDPRSLAETEIGGGIEALRRRLSDPLFADLKIDRAQLEAWCAAAPDSVDAFVRAFAQMAPHDGARPQQADGIAALRTEIERWRNHFADLDAMAETVSDELRLSAGDLYGAIADRLRVKHQLSVRILPVDTMPDKLRRLDLHARQLQISELLDPASRTFAAAFQLAQSEAKGEIDALVRGAGFAGRIAERLFRAHLTSYFAAAVMMPYARFLRACEATGYDIELLQRRFGAGFEQVAHRLTTLQRVGARGLPFFMIRIDRAGQSSKRYGGASLSALAGSEARCPLWRVHHSFDVPGRLLRQLVVLEDGTRWFTLSRTVHPTSGAAGSVRPEFAVGLGLEASLATTLASARGIDVRDGFATPIGLGCAACHRADCPQRSAPPRGRDLIFNDRERGLTAFTFAA